MDQILSAFYKNRETSLELIKAFPEEHLKTELAEGKRDFQYQLVHMCCGSSWWLANLFKDNGPEYHALGDTIKEICSLVEQHTEREKKIFLDPGKLNMDYKVFMGEEEKVYNGCNRLMYLYAHESHHRGKIVQWLTANGYTVPFMPF